MHLILLSMLAMYFLPSIIGWNKKDAGAIIAINVFLGWTFIGWVIALVWAITSAPAPTYVIVNQPDYHYQASYPNQPNYSHSSQGLFCSSCGKQSLPGGVFCSNCGRRI